MSTSVLQTFRVVPAVVVPPHAVAVVLVLGLVALAWTIRQRVRNRRSAARRRLQWPDLEGYEHTNPFQGKRLVAFAGKLGAGKTHSAMETAFLWAEQRKKVIVSNAEIDVRALEWYAVKHNMPHLAWIARSGQVFRCKDVKVLLAWRNAVVVLDEAGVFVASKSMGGRAYKDFEGFIADLLMARKNNTDVIWVCQVFEHVAAELRGVTELFFHMRSLFGKYKIKAGFDAYGYECYTKKPTWRNWIRHALVNSIGRFDADPFLVYNTTERLDGRVVPDPRDVLNWAPVGDSHEDHPEDSDMWLSRYGACWVFAPVLVPRVMGTRTRQCVLEAGPAPVVAPVKAGKAITLEKPPEALELLVPRALPDRSVTLTAYELAQEETPTLGGARVGVGIGAL